MKLTSIFSKFKSSDSFPQLESKPRDMDPEYEKLFPKKAVFGFACRTFALSNDQDKNKKLWLEASECVNGLWEIMKVEESPNWHSDSLALGDNIRKIAPYRPKPVSFPVMLKLFGEFEHESNPFNLRIIPDQDIKSLKPDHFTILAKNENIVFDTDGMPHPIRNGCLTTKGYFRPQDLEELRSDSTNMPLAPYFKKPNLISINENSGLGAIKTDITKQRLYIRTLLELMKTINKGLKTRLNKTSDISYKFDSFKKFLNSTYTQSSDPDRYVTCVGNPLLNARALSKKLENSMENNNLCMFFHEFQLFIGAKLLEDCLNTMKKGDKNASPDALTKIEEFIEATSSSYLELGGNKETLDALLTTFFEKDHNALSEEISDSLDNNLERLELIYDTLKKRVTYSPQKKIEHSPNNEMTWPPSPPLKKI